MPEGVGTNAQPPVGTPSGGAPFSPQPAGGPTPNSGMEMQGNQEAAIILDMMTQVLPKVGAGSETGKLMIDFISKLSKLVPPGSVSPAAKNNQLETAQRNNVQNGQMVAAMRARDQQPAAGAAA